jgi:hypothetical protein
MRDDPEHVLDILGAIERIEKVAVGLRRNGQRTFF